MKGTNSASIASPRGLVLAAFQRSGSVESFLWGDVARHMGDQLEVERLYIKHEVARFVGASRRDDSVEVGSLGAVWALVKAGLDFDNASCISHHLGKHEDDRVVDVEALDVSGHEAVQVVEVGVDWLVAETARIGKTLDGNAKHDSSEGPGVDC